MTKINKNFTIDEEIIHKLKKVENASKLINDLLEIHFKKIDDSNIFELKLRLKRLNKNLKNLDEDIIITKNRIKKLQNKITLPKSEFMQS